MNDTPVFTAVKTFLADVVITGIQTYGTGQKLIMQCLHDRDIALPAGMEDGRRVKRVEVVYVDDIRLFTAE